MLPANVRLDWKVIAKYKHSTLFGLVVRNEEKKFYNVDTRWSSAAGQKNPATALIGVRSHGVARISPQPKSDIEVDRLSLSKTLRQIEEEEANDINQVQMF